MRSLATALFVSLAVATASAQITATVSPQLAPLGCPIQITICNDTPSNIFIGDGCPWTITDASGVLVASGPCPLFVAINVPPGGCERVLPWHQDDMFGNQVPAGAYTVTVQLPDGTTTTDFVVVGATAAGLGQLGVHRPGTLRALYLCSPSDAGRVYVMGASLTTNTGIPVCGTLFPLDNDVLLTFSTMPGNGVFINFAGVLNSAGFSMAPLVATPNNPALSGAIYFVAYLTLDFALPCPISNISPAVPITIL